MYEKSVGGATRDIAQKLISVSPPFTSSSKILDNATGTGIMLEEIQKHISSTDSSSTLKLPVVAADVAPAMIDCLNAKLKQVQSTNSWPNLGPVTTHAVPAEQLDESIVPDNSITHAYMNFGLFFCNDALQAASHIHRALSAGGTAHITSWNHIGYLAPIQQTHRELYPDGREVKMPFSEDWLHPSYNHELLVKAGFKQENVKVDQTETFMRHTSLQVSAAILTGMFTPLIKGPQGWESEEAKTVFTKKLAENLGACKDFIDESAQGKGVGTRMIANVAVCTK